MYPDPPSTSIASSVTNGARLQIQLEPLRLQGARTPRPAEAGHERHLEADIPGIHAAEKAVFATFHADAADLCVALGPPQLDQLRFGGGQAFLQRGIERRNESLRVDSLDQINAEYGGRDEQRDEHFHPQAHQVIEGHRPAAATGNRVPELEPEALAGNPLAELLIE